MTEREWLKYRHPAAMLARLARKVSQRKRRLFGLACCRRVWHLLTEEGSRQALLVAERFADGQANLAELQAAQALAQSACKRAGSPPYGSHYAAGGCVWYVVRKHASDAVQACSGSPSALQTRALEERGSGLGMPDYYEIMHGVWDAEHAYQCAVVRDLVGPLPYRRLPAVAPRWLMRDVVTLAWAAYEERQLPQGTLDPARLAVLADALEEAGCTDPDILGHLRSPGPHVRGCWVVDTLLGKE